MAEENEQVQEQAEEAPQGATKPETDWKAEARKWEAYAKKGIAAEKELEELKAAQMTEQEKAIARAEAAEKSLAELEARQELQEAAKEISAGTGCPREFLELCADRDGMERMAKLYAAEKESMAPRAAPHAKASKVDKSDGKPLNVRDKFAAMFE